FSFDRVGERAALRVALDAGVVRFYVVHSRRIQNIAARGMVYMSAPRTMAALAAYVPLRHLFGLNVVVNRMASVARRTCGPFHIIGGIEWLPPVPSLCDHVRTPRFVDHVPLR